MKNLEQRVFRVVNLDPPLNENLCFLLTLNLDSKQATELQNAILWLYGLYQRMASQGQGKSYYMRKHKKTAN